MLLAGWNITLRINMLAVDKLDDSARQELADQLHQMQDEI